MLVLTRKLGEAIYIGDGITITVVEIKGNRIQLGIDAPPSVPILRSELARATAYLPNENKSHDSFRANTAACRTPVNV